jgi:hypothetical protein
MNVFERPRFPHASTPRAGFLSRKLTDTIEFGLLKGDLSPFCLIGIMRHMKENFNISQSLGLTLAVMVLVVSGCSDSGDSLSPDGGPSDDDLVEGILFDVAGISGDQGSSGDGGNALDAKLAFPQDVLIDPNGVLYIVDYMNHSIRMVDASGTISRFAGTGIEGDGLSGSPDQVALERPANIAFGASNDLWISDWKNCKVKRLDLMSMTVSSPIGSVEGYAGDGGPANLAQLDHPSCVLFGFNDNTGAIFTDKMYISDQVNQRIRVVDPGMNITTHVGSGVKGYKDGSWDVAQFSFPDGSDPIPGGRIAWGHHPYGLLIADTDNNCIRYVSDETKDVFTLVGDSTAGYSGDGERARFAKLNRPTDVLVSIDHEIFICDTYNHVIRKIDAVGIIHTVVGTGIAGSSPDGTTATEAMLNTPSGISWDEATRTLYIADTYNHQVKKVKLRR